MSSTRRYELFRSRLDRFTRMLPGVESGKVGAVHRTRAAARRLREILPILEIEPSAVRKLNRRLRKVTKRLGPVRELDVLLQLIDELRQIRRLPARALARVAADVRTERDKAKGRRPRKAVAGDVKRTIRKLEALAEELQEGDGRSRAWRWAIDARVASRAAKLKDAIREAGAMYQPERLHAVRLAVKKLRYGFELSVEAAGLKNTPELGTLRRAQDLLGRLRDLQVLIVRVRRVQTSLPPTEPGAWRELDDLVIPIEHHCRLLHARYVRNRGALTALCDRLGARGTTSTAARRAG
jgi:CHAD domain-containing protein